MGHRVKQKRQPDLIYRSRQANRTDIEELLGPSFDPTQARPFPAPETTTSSQIAANNDASSSGPDSSLLPGSSLVPSSSLHTGSSQPIGSSLLPGHSKAKDILATTERTPAGNRLAPGSSLLPGSGLISGLQLSPATSLLPGSELTRSPERDKKGKTAKEKTEDRSWSNSLPGSQLRTGNGRIIHLREVRSVQDAHTKGEHDLLKEMWKRGREESSNTRLLRAGLSELSLMCGSHKTSCRSYVRALTEKLALEEVESYQAAAGLLGARVYRIYSFDEIRNRRRRAGLTHVVRTGAVTFVDPRTGLKLPPVSDLLPVSTLSTGGNLPPDRNLPPDSGSSLLSTPGSNLLPSSNNNYEQENIRTTTTTNTTADIHTDSASTIDELEALILDSPYSAFDRNAITTIVKQSRERVYDVSAIEIYTLFQEKAGTLIGNRRIENFTGILIWAWSGFFTQGRVNSLREAKRKQKELDEKQRLERIETYREIINDPSTPEQWREEARRGLADEGISSLK